ncbi:uncharacterized protein LOC121876588 isoform X2 [Homarus americanus]|nr:uncharacterized protein LOC121876588 isoform X2 [Homarus americanus]
MCVFSAAAANTTYDLPGSPLTVPPSGPSSDIFGFVAADQPNFLFVPVFWDKEVKHEVLRDNQIRFEAPRNDKVQVAATVSNQVKLKALENDQIKLGAIEENQVMFEGQEGHDTVDVAIVPEGELQLLLLAHIPTKGEPGMLTEGNLGGRRSLATREQHDVLPRSPTHSSSASSFEYVFLKSSSFDYIIFNETDHTINWYG